MAPDPSGAGGVQLVLRAVRDMIQEAARGTLSAAQRPEGWVRSAASTSTAVSVDHPPDWRGQVFGQDNRGVVISAQVQLRSADGRNLFEGETRYNVPAAQSAALAQAALQRIAAPLGMLRWLAQDDWQEQIPGGLLRLAVSFRAVETQDYVVVAWAMATLNLGLAGQGFNIGSWTWKVIASPKATFTRAVPAVFVPMILSATW